MILERAGRFLRGAHLAHADGFRAKLRKLLLEAIALQVRQISDFAGAVADFVDGNAHAVQHRNEEVRHRGFGSVFYLPSWLQSSAATPGKRRLHILVLVSFTVAE